MKTHKGFILLEKDEIRDWLTSCDVDRQITEIQNHHTYLPDHGSFNRDNNHFKWLEGMKNYHVGHNGWSDIAQNITSFPDGKIAICRPLSTPPSGIKGHNARGLCIEHLGNFDEGQDEMNPAHQETVIHLNAALCERFKLQATQENIIYHHWFHEKTCPGTAFFGGNTREAAERWFLPLVKAELTAIGEKPQDRKPEDEKVLGLRMVNVASLNIRSGPGTKYSKAGSVHGGNILNVYEENAGWARISADNDRWVSARYLLPVSKGRVLADTLNIRSGPGTEYRVLGTLGKGSEVLIYETENGWCRIDLNEKWVSGKYVGE